MLRHLTGRTGTVCQVLGYGLLLLRHLPDGLGCSVAYALLLAVCVVKLCEGRSHKQLTELHHT